MQPRTQLRNRRRLNIENLEPRRLLTTTGYSNFELFTDSSLSTAGLTGSYVDRSLRNFDQPDWRTSQTIAGTRVDSRLFFSSDSFGVRSEVGLTRGTDDDWENFSVQWDGILQVTTADTVLATRSDDGSRMWIDINQDGDFLDADELIDNNWGSGQAITTGEVSRPLAAGTYAIRVQYEESGGTNRFGLISNPVQTTHVSPDFSHRVRIAYLIPENRQAQPEAEANLQAAIPLMQNWFAEQMDRWGFGRKSFEYETEADGVTPKVHIVGVGVEDSHIREDIWRHTIDTGRLAGLGIWNPGEVWLVIPESHVQDEYGDIQGGTSLGAGFGNGSSGGMAIVGSERLFSLAPEMMTNDQEYAGEIVTEVGPHPLVFDESFDWFLGNTFSSLSSSIYGAIMHEMAHGFGLPHDFRNDANFVGNMMGNGLRGIRGTVHPDRYPTDDSWLSYGSALMLNSSRYFSENDAENTLPSLSTLTQGSVAPNADGTITVNFTASDSAGLASAMLIRRNTQFDPPRTYRVAELPLGGATSTATAFTTSDYRTGATDLFTIVVLDVNGNRRELDYFDISVTGGQNAAPLPSLRPSDTLVAPGQVILLDASRSRDPDGNDAALVVEWDWEGDGVYDTPPSISKAVNVSYDEPGTYLVSARLTDPSGGQASTAPLAIRVRLPGDTNDDGELNLEDLDALNTNVALGPSDTFRFDLDRDGSVTVADRDLWLSLAGEQNLGPGLAYLPGDSNLDGVVDVSDFNNWNSNKFTFNAKWSQGDFNADGAVEVADFNVWNQYKFQQSVPALSRNSNGIRKLAGSTRSLLIEQVFADRESENQRSE
ncbi:MAG: PKD domain-containing protein [Planctomycetota bacterium]